jgi:hypothetical protein
MPVNALLILINVGKPLENFAHVYQRLLANECCSEVTTYSSPEATRNAMGLLFQTMPNHVNTRYKKKV